MAEQEEVPSIVDLIMTFTRQLAERLGDRNSDLAYAEMIYRSILFNGSGGQAICDEIISFLMGVRFPGADTKARLHIWNLEIRAGGDNWEAIKTQVAQIFSTVRENRSEEERQRTLATTAL